MKRKYYAHAQGFSANNRIDEPVLFYQLLFSNDHNDNRHVVYESGESESDVVKRFEKKYPNLKCVWKDITDGKSTWKGYEIVEKSIHDSHRDALSVLFK